MAGLKANTFTENERFYLSLQFQALVPKPFYGSRVKFELAVVPVRLYNVQVLSAEESKTRLMPPPKIKYIHTEIVKLAFADIICILTRKFTFVYM